jgi:hypothetical protein
MTVQLLKPFRIIIESILHTQGVVVQNGIRVNIDRLGKRRVKAGENISGQ